MAGVAVLFAASAALSSRADIVFPEWLSRAGAAGPLIYVALNILAVVAAPLSTLPLVPVATAVWGPTHAALLCIAGWSAGGALAFLLARRFGLPLVARLAGPDRMRAMQDRMPAHNLFLGVLLLRMVVPVDVLSYAVGLLTPMRFAPYLAATVLGVTPFAFVFAYAATVPWQWQTAAVALALAAFAIGYLRRPRRRRISAADKTR